MAADNNLGVADQEFIDAARYISDYGNDLQKNMEKYCRCLNFICEMAIKDQKIDKKLMNLSKEVEALREEISEISNQAAKVGKDFVKKIDKVDKFLY